MFDKLIESDSTDADFKPRRNYFMVSAVVMGIMFLVAVVINLYAQEFDLGTNEFEISMIVAPVTPSDPEPPAPKEQNRPQETKSELPSRQANILRIDEPPIVPANISVTPSTQLSRPPGDYSINLALPESDGTGVSQPGNPNGTGAGSDHSASTIAQVEPEGTTAPPPVIKKEIKPPTVKSEGVINGKATYLPKPFYSPAAIAIRAEGEVNVQVTIDESGKVISSKAVSGHPLLKPSAEKAAWNAKFSPTYLSKVAVKVTGVIVYRFSRN